MQLVFNDYPNRYVTVLTPGDTAWHFFQLPQPSNGAVVLALNSNAAQTGAGATSWLYGGPSAATPTYGFAVPAGQALTSFENQGFWYKLTTATDALNITVAY
jgi:hypothetical protein